MPTLQKMNSSKPESGDKKEDDLSESLKKEVKVKFGTSLFKNLPSMDDDSVQASPVQN